MNNYYLERKIKTLKMELRLHTADFAVMGVFLVVSLGIGVYYGVFKRQRTTEEYLMGNRQMQILPVALSMLVTYQSAISVIGIPAEFYLYQTMFCYVWIGIIASIVAQCYMIVPLMFPLHLTSAYEYLGRRFRSRSIQLFSSLLGMLQTLVYMSMVLLAPSLALEAVAGIPLWISVVLVGIVGTVYTSLGGLRSVIWTDVFQFVIMFTGIIVILILGSVRLGSYSNIWNLCKEGGRIQFAITDIDPRVRHTLWSCLIGGAFNWLPLLCNQSAVQRICSMKTMKESKYAVLLNIPLTLLYGVLLFFLSSVMFAYYANKQCDPLQAGFVSNGNQVAPYFVMDILSNLPGLAGLFLAALFSGALSSLSSGINAMGANTVQDILSSCLRNTTQRTKTVVAKITVFVYGAVAVSLAYLAKDFGGPVTQISLSAAGAIGGPGAGMIFLGGLFPHANWIGGIAGGLTGLTINLWVSIGSVLYGKKAPRSPPIGTTQCFDNTTTLETNIENVTSLLDSVQTTSVYSSSTADLSTSEPGHLVIYDVSYLYIGLIGFLVTIISGLLVSAVVSRISSVDDTTSPEYIFPFMRGIWTKTFKQWMKLAEFELRDKVIDVLNQNTTLNQQKDLVDDVNDKTLPVDKY